MSKANRTEFQKARRVYLDKCKKDGKKPMDVDAFYKAWHKKMQKKVNSDAKPKAAKPEEHKESGKIHMIHKGDTIQLVNFTPRRIVSFAIRLLAIVEGSLPHGLSAPADALANALKAQKKDKKPAKR